MPAAVQIMGMIPGLAGAPMSQNQDAASQDKLQRYMTIMDSMTDAELDHKDVKKLQSDQARIRRLARGSGRRPVRGWPQQLRWGYRSWVSTEGGSAKWELIRAVCNCKSIKGEFS